MLLAKKLLRDNNILIDIACREADSFKGLYHRDK